MNIIFNKELTTSFWDSDDYEYVTANFSWHVISTEYKELIRI